ncbi:uncharacterized protein LOC110975837 [Acanthaster planci]|uniref:Uncharacterized protein LOC110975837 n=1 Tax=Acanthaster planci TaxID=133434 RepID=A0A8B7XVT9_ACAPL|nr:uncharacterized protein LOC110975837 [Acanthaster planci]
MNALTVFASCCFLLGQMVTCSAMSLRGYQWEEHLMRLKHGGSAVATSSQLAVSTISRYSTVDVQTFQQDESRVFIGRLCGQSVGDAVNVTVLLNNNPGWEPVKGVVEYFVIDSNYQEGVLCSNKDSNGYATPNCLIESWPNKYDIIVIATAGSVSGIAFTLNAEFYDEGTEAASYVKANLPTRRHAPSNLGASVKELSRKPVILTESVLTFPSVSLGYLEEALISFTWCGNTETHIFAVASTITSVDGESSFAQYMCKTLPCDVGVNNIAHNGDQLPSNTVLTDPMTSKENLYVVVVNWGGPYDEEANKYIGNFLFNADQVRYY